MKQFIKNEFCESPLHQQLMEILLKKYKLNTFKEFEDARLNNYKFEEEFEILLQSYEDFINDDV